MFYTHTDPDVPCLSRNMSPLCCKPGKKNLYYSQGMRCVYECVHAVKCISLLGLPYESNTYWVA